MPLALIRSFAIAQDDNSFFKTKLSFCFPLPASGLLASCLLLASCTMNPNTQKPGEAYLQGEWQQDPTPVQNRMMTYSLYHIKFTCDSFFMQQQTFSKINYGADSCMGSGHWSEYMRGTYQQKNDTLHVKGVFCNADQSLKLEGGCFRMGIYEDYFKINSKSDSLLQFTGNSSVLPISLRLVKRLTCHIKPL